MDTAAASASDTPLDNTLDHKKSAPPSNPMTQSNLTQLISSRKQPRNIHPPGSQKPSPSRYFQGGALGSPPFPAFCVGGAWEKSAKWPPGFFFLSGQRNPFC
eukprot:FR734548.1.p4 GENE.FR734548.1~~FR734548.1.p4  ORF type:complete len:102 (+),score=29.88 FR734548.1:831-1136(+)